MSKKIWMTLLVGVILAVFFALPIMALSLLENQLKSLNRAYEYLIVAVIGLVTNATIMLPTPTMMPVIIEIADRNSLLLIAGVYAFFAAFGESSGYFLGRLGNKIPAIEHSRSHKTLKKWMHGRWTGIILFGLALSPSPFDIGGMIAGNAKYPIQWFLLATFLGRWIKYLYLIPAWEWIEQLLSGVSWIGDFAGIFMMLMFFVLFLILERQALLNFLKGKGWNF